VTSGFLPPEQWYAQLPTLYSGACALITDADDRVLLVKPNYRAEWGIPGGWLDEGEKPRDGCAREVREEIGLDLPIGDLLVAQWCPAEPPRPRAMVTWVFDAGTLDPDRIARIRLQADEIDDFAFVDADDAVGMLPATDGPRITAGLRARADKVTFHLDG